MIPYIGAQTYAVFGLHLQVWGTMIALCFIVGTYLAWRRAKQKKQDTEHILNLSFWILLCSFVGSRFVHVFLYEPSYYLAHPLEAIDPRQPGFAIFGGFIGAFFAFYAYVRKHGLAFLEYADTLVWALPWGCGIGRIGCFLIHDHPGTLTHFMLGVRYPDGQVRHDLGLYLSLIGFATGGLFLLLNRKQRNSGFWFGTYMLIEGIVRFGLDFLRVNDTRYFGLTPTQYLAVPLALLGLWFIRRAHLKHD